MEGKGLNSILQRIGKALGTLRVKKGYNNIKDFAMDNDLPMIQYWRFERGKANITIKTLNKLLSIHRLTIEDFFCLMNDYNPTDSTEQTSR
jgi:transcriptional regulator with XRE-family HTH domain